MSESKRRSLVAIGNSRVIPAQAGIQRRRMSVSKRRSLVAIGNSRVIPAQAVCVIPAEAGIQCH